MDMIDSFLPVVKKRKAKTRAGLKRNDLLGQSGNISAITVDEIFSLKNTTFYKVT